MMRVICLVQPLVLANFIRILKGYDGKVGEGGLCIRICS